MVALKLSLKTREVSGKKVQELREKGLVPTVLYGHGVEPKSLSVPYGQFEKVYKEAGDSTLIDLEVDGGQAVKAVVQDVQLDPTSDKFLHVDFHQVRMDEKMTKDIPLEFIGEPPAVKELNAILVTAQDTVEVECLPSDLPAEIEVDLSTLKTFDDVIHVSDIKAPQGVTILNNPDDPIALVQEPRKEEEAVPAAPVEEDKDGKKEDKKESTEENKEDK